jgi:hypothetical protein
MLSALYDFFIFWIFPIAALVCLIPSFYYSNSKHFGTSSFFMIISAVLAGTYFWSDISPLLQEHGKTFSILFLSAVYVAAGVVTSFVYWVFYNWKAKERFDRLLNNKTTPKWATSLAPEIQMSLRKYFVIADTDSRREIFDDYDGNLRIDVAFIDAVANNNADGINQAVLDATVADVLPPRFKICKSFIVGAGCSWPITVIWLLISRVVKQLIERFISLFGGTFDKISKLAFGKF